MDSFEVLCRQRRCVRFDRRRRRGGGAGRGERPQGQEEALNIDGAIATLATGDSSRVGGELVWWTDEALPEAARVARSLGMAFVRSQPLIDQEIV